MNVSALAEAVILQSFADLWDKAHWQESLEFFAGGGFDYYAGIAGLEPAGKTKLLLMFERQMEAAGHRGPQKKKHSEEASDRCFF